MPTTVPNEQDDADRVMETSLLHTSENVPALEQAKERVKRLAEEAPDEQPPAKEVKPLQEETSMLVIKQMIDEGKTGGILEALIAKDKVPDLVKAIVTRCPGNTGPREVVKGLLSTRRGIMAIPYVRRPEMKDAVVIQSVNDQGLIKESPGYMWINHKGLDFLSCFYEMIEQSRTLNDSPRGALGGWTLNWTKEGDCLAWVTETLGGLEWDAPQGVYLNAGFDELDNDNDGDRDEHGMNEYDRFMDNNSGWNQDNYEDYAPRFVEKIAELLPSRVLTAEQVDKELSYKNVGIDIIGTITINYDSW